MKQDHRSASSSRQRIDQPPTEGLTTRLVPVEVDLKQQIFDVCSSLNDGHSPKGRLRQLCAKRTWWLQKEAPPRMGLYSGLVLDFHRAVVLVRRGTV